MKKLIVILILLLPVTVVFGQQRYIQFVYVSDCHYGIERDFRGETGVMAKEVNKAMIEAIEALPSLVIPEDGGEREGETIAWVDYLINTGDIANRAEKGVQRSVRSWRQFERDWNRLELRNADGGKTPLFLTPGNHDISNAIGHPSIPRRKVDATAAAEIYNAMLKPAEPVSKRSYRRDLHVCNYSFEDSGVCFAFLDMWPDGRNRAWLETKLDSLSEGEVCLLFVHDQPDIEAKHLKGPFSDGFENLVGDASSVVNPRDVPVREHEELKEFLRTNPEIKAYFHGNENYNEFYSWGDSDAPVSVFRVDSPMKGAVSSDDEAMLSFQFAVIDTEERTLTVREYFWNRKDRIWGETRTVKL